MFSKVYEWGCGAGAVKRSGEEVEVSRKYKRGIDLPQSNGLKALKKVYRFLISLVRGHKYRHDDDHI